MPTDENVIRLWACAPNLKELHQIKELAVDVTANLIWLPMYKSDSYMRSSWCDYIRSLGHRQLGHYSPLRGFLWP